MQPIVIIGAGGFGREVHALLEDINRAAPTWEILGFADDNPSALAPFDHYGPVRWLIDELPLSLCRNYVCAVGDPDVRKAIVERLAAKNLTWPALIHPTASVGAGSRIGDGLILCRNSIVTVDTSVGNHVHINMAATVGHDTHVGDYCTLSAHVDVCGDVRLGEGVFLGSHASVTPMTKVGAWARIGAGSVALGTVRSKTTVLGVPAVRIPTPPED